MARKKKAAAAGSTPAEKRTRKKVDKMPDGTFAVKLRVGPITEDHMKRLASMKGIKNMRKCTRKTMQAHLLAHAQAEVARILLQPVLVLEGTMPTSDADLLS